MSDKATSGGCEVATDEDLRMAVRRALARLEMSWDDLERSATIGKFPTEQARLTWSAIRELKYLVCDAS